MHAEVRRLVASLFMSGVTLALSVAALAQPAAPPEPPRDPMGRTSPRSTLSAFVRAVDRNDFVAAARHLQVTESQRQNTETLARDLNVLMDRHFSQPLASINDSPNGALDDGLPIDRERVGPLVIDKSKTDIMLVRVTDPQAGPVWLIASETLAQVPALRQSMTQTWVERRMPATLVNRELFGLSLAYWIVLAACIALSLLLLRLTFAGGFLIAGWIFKDAGHRHVLEIWHDRLRWPAITALTIGCQLMTWPSLGVPLTARFRYGRIAWVILVVALAWLARRLLTLGFARARSLARGRSQTTTESLMLLGERLGKAVVLVLAVLAILMIAGVDIQTTLAGLGIAGVALALGAQKTVENFLGGLFLLTDRAIAVGDFCSISNRQGWVEDITLRSVRLRTRENTLVSVPAGVLAQAGIENFATRSKILLQNILRLRHGTDADQIRHILTAVRQRLDDHPRFEPRTSRIRLVNFAAEAIELELYAYVLTSDMPDFLEVREELLLDIAGIVEGAGSAFAGPTQFIHARDAPSNVQVDRQKATS